MSRRLLSRRTFLRGSVAGASVALALPTLDAMLDSNGAFADGTTEQPFFGVFYWANGLPWNDKHSPEHGGHPDLWTPATTGAGYAATPLLMPLARHQASVVSGLEPKTIIPDTPPGLGDGHMRGFMVALTGDMVKPEGFDHPSHTLTALRESIDVYVARHPSFYTQPARFRSIQVGVSGARFHDYGHWNAISYNGPNSLNLPMMEPSQLYDLLFSIPSDAPELARRARALDAVLDDARSLRVRLGSGDQSRLDEHLEHLNQIHQRFTLSAAVCTAPGRPADGGDLHTKTRAMGDLLAIAINCNLTRVFSFMLTSPATTHIFSNLGVPDGMHKVCHDGQWEWVRAITQHQMEAFGIFLDAFAAIAPATGGTLLDRACIYGTSEYGEGWRHDVKELPVVIAGGACGRLTRGVHVREPNGNIAKAQLSCLRAIGLPDTSFGWNGGEATDVYSDLVT